ncbi:hypothetical protein [Streptomyces sp. NPDC002530]
MSTARLSTPEIVSELLSALADDGWLARSTVPAGPGPIALDAGLGDIANAFRACSRSGSLPPVAAHELERAAAAADRAEALGVTDSAALYGALGTALAHLVQARRASIPDAPEFAG